MEHTERTEHTTAKLQAKSSRHTSMLWQPFFSQSPRFVGATVATAMASAAAFVVPLLLQVLLDSVFRGEPLPPFPWLQALIASVGGVDYIRSHLWVGMALICGFTFCNGFSSFCASRWSAVAAENSTRTLRNTLYDHLQNVSIAYHAKTNTGDLLQRCTSDVDTVRRFFAIQMMEVGRVFTMVALAVPVMLRLHSRLTIAAMFLFPIMFYYTFRFFLNMHKTFLKADEAEGVLSAMMQEHLTGIRVVRAFAHETLEMRTFDAKNDAYWNASHQVIKLLARYWSISHIIATIQLAITLGAGVWLTIQGQLTIGGLLVFLVLEQMLLWPISHVGMILADMSKARVAVTRMASILKTPREDNEDTKDQENTTIMSTLPQNNTARAVHLKPVIYGAITFENVGFSYKQDVPILQHITFSVPAGATIGILGNTGSGKSTLMYLLTRLYNPTEGRILIDGTDITRIDRKWIRRHIGIVLQEPFLYARSLRSNISFARSSATENDIVTAARSAAIHDVIEGFQHGYDTPVGEKGITLSGGQKQRVAIARALMMQSPILVFDDSLSAVDNKTDTQIRTALLENAATTFLISHRATTLIRTDTIIVLKNGRIIEQDAPQELLKQDGHFANVWNLQEGSYHAGIH